MTQALLHGGNTPANCAADLYHLLLGGKCHSDSAQHAVLVLNSVLFDCMCIELAEVQEVVLGCDGTHLVLSVSL